MPGSQKRTTTEMRIVVGSKSEHKLGAVSEAVRRMNYAPFLKEGVYIEGVDVPSGVNNQPIGLKETFIGARARAYRALRKTDDLAIGIESGILEINNWDRYVDISVIFALDNNGWSRISMGSGIEFDEKYVLESYKTKYEHSAGSFIAGEHGGDSTNATAILTKQKISRMDTLVLPVQTILWQYLLRSGDKDKE